MNDLDGNKRLEMEKGENRKGKGQNRKKKN
jgi:hypothetical protein